MADQWNNIGWTAQQPPLVNDSSGATPTWQIPSDVDTVTVTAEFHGFNGSVARGFVVFAAQTDHFVYTSTANPPIKAELMMPKWSASIGTDGKAILRIPATDTAVLSPNPFTYQVQVVIDYQLNETFKCSLPKATPNVNLVDITRLP